MIVVDRLTKDFGGFRAVDGLDLEVAEGEIVGLLGPNGAGKTTTLRMIAGLVRPTAGRVAIGGYDIVRDPVEARRISSFIPDRPFLYEKLTGFESLEFVAGLYSLDRRGAAERGAELLDLFGIGRWADTLVEAYSHGMRQRLVFAAALLPKPRFLAVDEPMVGLDPRGARLVKEVLRNLADSEGLSVLLSTHTLDVAEEVCDRIAIIHRSHRVALGTMAELRAEADRPGSRLEEVFLRLTEEGGGEA